MANLGPFPVEFGAVFPFGAFAAGPVEKVRDFDRSSGDRVIQQSGKASGLPLWVVEVINPDPETRQRTNAASLSPAARCQPVWVTFGLRAGWVPGEHGGAPVDQGIATSPSI
jgi:hypothetical protein